jgi:hypothetical protein
MKRPKEQKAMFPPCSHLLCLVSFESIQELRYHLQDVHCTEFAKGVNEAAPDSPSRDPSFLQSIGWRFIFMYCAIKLNLPVVTARIQRVTRHLRFLESIGELSYMHESHNKHNGKPCPMYLKHL